MSRKSGITGIDKDDTSPLRWWLYEKRQSSAEATKTYCYQCSGDAHACGSIKLEACEPLLRCLKPRRVTVAQCRKAFPAGY